MIETLPGQPELADQADGEALAFLARRLLDESPLAELAHVVLGLIAGYLTWDIAPPGAVVPWVSAVVVAAAGRSWLRRRARREPDARVALGLMRTGVVSLALAWSGGLFLVSPYLDIERIALVEVLFCGLLASATVSLLADRTSFYLFVITLLAPLVVAIGLNGTSRSHQVGITFVLAFGGIMAVFYRQAHDALSGQFRIARRLERSERTAHRERTLLDALIAGAPSAIVVLREGGQVVRVNRAFEALFGYAEAEAVGATIASLVMVPGEAEAYEAFYRRIWSGETVVQDARRRRKDGSVREMRVAGAPVEVDDGRAAFVIYDDVTERRSADRQVREAEERYRQLVESASDLVWRVDTQGRFTFVNAAGADIFGLEPAALLGRELSEFAHPDYRERDQETFAEVLAGRPVLDHETVLCRVDGSPTAINTSAHPIWDAAGERVEGVQGIARDIGAQVVAREAMAAARQAAEEAAEARSAFLANMSHEIRTPMNGILGMVELLLDTTLDAEQRRSVELIRDSGEALLTIINDILDFSKIEAGQLALEETQFDLPALVEGTVRLHTPRAFERGLELVCDIGPDVPRLVLGDPGRLRQVLNNLMGNALKFTHKGEVVVSLGAVSQNDGRAVLRFAVRDTGIGIRPEHLGAIFEAFKQADASTTRRYGGTGLGLSISRRLVHMMGSSLEVTSEVGRGSEFTFVLSLPVGRGEVAPAPRASLDGKRILVVDDHPTNRLVTRGILTWAGCVVEEAEDGLQGLTRLQEAQARGTPFDLVLSDVHMPGRDGFELAEAIRADAHVGETRIILLTSAGRRGDGQRCRDLGVSAYLLKPASRHEVLEAAVAALGERARRPSVQLVTRHSIQETRRGVKVLLAEDNPVNQEVAAAMLRRRGHDVTIVANGRLAVEAVREGGFDVVLMDLQMPELDGIRATTEIRELLDGRPLPIVAVTANALSGERERCLAAGMDDYLAKPFKPHDLFAAVEGWAARGAGPSPLPRPAAPPPAPEASDEAPVDIDGFRAEMREAGIEDSVGELMGLFLRDAPGRLAALEEAGKGTDAHAMERAAHAFKSAAAAIRAGTLARLLKDAEAAGRGGDAETVRTLLPGIRQAVVAASAHLAARGFITP